MNQGGITVRFGTWLVLALPAGWSVSAAAEEFSDTFIGYRYGSKYREPNNPFDIAKNIVQFTHASTYSLGANFFNVDYFKSDSKDPANGADSGGAAEAYLTYRNHLQYGKVTGTPLALGCS
jgi:hypothetical protein